MSRSLSLALVSLIALTAPAFADPYETRSEVVSYADLDLSTAADTDILLDRIHTAARHVCNDGPGVQPLASSRDEQNCRGAAEEEAVLSSNNGYLIARYRGYEPNIVVGDAGDYPTTVTTVTTVTVKKPT